MDEKFFFTTDTETLEKIEKELKKRNIPYDTLVWTGYFPMPNSKVVLDYGGEDDTKCYFFSKHFLDKSEDGVFAGRRFPDEEPKKLPNVKDVFKIVKL